MRAAAFLEQGLNRISSDELPKLCPILHENGLGLNAVLKTFEVCLEFPGR
jgi:hypothetical protein